MFKLFITVMVLSNTGAVSQNSIVTDYDDPVACERMAKEINGTTEVKYPGLDVSAKVWAKAICDTRQRGMAQNGQVPPPVAQFFTGMGQFLQRQ
jgi:hypothetical protein